MGERGYQRYREEFTLEAFEKRFAMLILQAVVKNEDEDENENCLWGV
jgi:hypothetical protein